MVDKEALSLLCDESMGYATAIERRLEMMSGCDLSKTYLGPKVWSLHEQQVWSAIFETAGRCFELGGASLQFAHEFIAILSSLGEINSAAARSRGQLLAAAIETITIASTELQKSAEKALDAMSALKGFDHRAELHMIISALGFNLPWCLAQTQHLPLGQWAAKLWGNASSMNGQEIAPTGVTVDKVIAVFQGHVVRVCLHGLSLTEKFGPSSTENIDSPLMGIFHREVLPDVADYLGVLVNYVKDYSWNGHWNSNKLRDMLDKNIISMLMHLETHLSDFLDEMTLPLSELLTRYAAVFTSLLNAFVSMFAVEEHLDKLTASNTHLLFLGPSIAFQPLLVHRELSQQALLKAHSDVNFLISRLKQLQQDSIVRGWPTLPENIPEPLNCFKCMITTLLNHSETVLLRQIHQWEWISSEPKSGVTFLDAIRPLFSRSSRTERARHLTIFKRLFPYQKEWVGNLVELDAQSPRTLHPPSPLDLAFGPDYDQQSFWAQLSLQDKKMHSTELQTWQGRKLQDHWRPCTCKKQVEFMAQSHRVRSRFQINNGQGNTTETYLPTLPLYSKRKSINAKNNGGSFQGDWSF